MLTEYGVDPDTDVTLVPNNDATAEAPRQLGPVASTATRSSFPNALIPEVEGWGALWLNFAEDLPSLVPFAFTPSTRPARIPSRTRRPWLVSWPRCGKHRKF